MSAQLNGEHTMIVLDRRSLKLSASVVASAGMLKRLYIVLYESMAIQMNVKHELVQPARYHASLPKLTSCRLSLSAGLMT